MPELVSTVIITHKRHPRILKRAIDSVYAQTYQHFELFVIDDAPDYEQHTDIVTLTQQYDPRLQYIINSEKKGPAGSRNLGISMAKGSFIAFLDDDDEWLPNKLTDMLTLFTPEVGLVYSAYNIISPHHLKEKKPIMPYQGDIFPELLLHQNFIGGASVPILRKSSLDVVGGFDESFYSAEDYDLWLRIAKNNKVAYFDKSTLNYYISDDAISNDASQTIISRQKLLVKYAADLEKYPKAKKKIYSIMLYCYFYQGQLMNAFRFYKQHRQDISCPMCIFYALKGCIKRILLLGHVHKR